MILFLENLLLIKLKLQSKLDDFDFEKKLNEISNKINDVKISLENKIEDYYKQNEEDIMEIKELFNW